MPLRAAASNLVSFILCLRVAGVLAPTCIWIWIASILHFSFLFLLGAVKAPAVLLPHGSDLQHKGVLLELCRRDEQPWHGLVCALKQCLWSRFLCFSAVALQGACSVRAVAFHSIAC